MRILKFISLSFMMFALVTPAFAANITQDGATQLQQQLSKEITSRKDIKFAGSKADFKGDVTVTPKDSYYQVTLPYLKLTDKKSNTLDVGKLVMNMVPTDNASEWKSSVSLPSSLTYSDAAGKNSGVLSLGTQKASGIWDMDMFGFKKLTASYGDVTYLNSKTKEGTAISNVSTDYDFTKSADGFSGPVNVTANDIAYVDTSSQKSPLAKSLKVNSQIKADKAAPNGYKQSSQVEINGLSNAVRLISQKLKDPAQAGKAQLQKTLGILSVLQMSGKPVGGNTDISSYDVVTNAKGITTLNGVDISLLLTAASIK